MPTIKESHISERIEKSEIPLSDRPAMFKNKNKKMFKKILSNLAIVTS